MSQWWVAVAVAAIAVLGVLKTYSFDVMEEKISFNGENITLSRDEHGVVHIYGQGDNHFAFGLGYAHARDRLVQMVLVRAAAQGRLVELFPGNDDTLTMDILARSMDFQGRAKALKSLITNASLLEYLDAYSSGVNHYMATHWRPWELALVGVHPEPWKTEDCTSIGLIMGYLGRRLSLAHACTMSTVCVLFIRTYR